jgi:hypothetical protein
MWTVVGQSHLQKRRQRQQQQPAGEQLDADDSAGARATPATGAGEPVGGSGLPQPAALPTVVEEEEEEQDGDVGGNEATDGEGGQNVSGADTGAHGATVEAIPSASDAGGGTGGRAVGAGHEAMEGAAGGDDTAEGTPKQQTQRIDAVARGSTAKELRTRLEQLGAHRGTKGKRKAWLAQKLVEATAGPAASPTENTDGNGGNIAAAAAVSPSDSCR